VPAARLPVGGANSRATSNAGADEFPAGRRRNAASARQSIVAVFSRRNYAAKKTAARLRTETTRHARSGQGDERNFARYQERTQRLAEEVQRAESNVSSLRRELALLRQQ